MMRILPLALVPLLLAGCASSGNTDLAGSPAAPRTVQPGAPGQPTRAVSAAEIQPGPAPYTRADVAFMQGMIGHHAQALDMTALIGDRSERQDLILLGKRIEVSQKSEIAMMQRWLRARGEEAPEATAQHMMHGHTEMMPGMLTAAQMAELAASDGDGFYRLFLQYMIQHHGGAITMVDELFSQEGAAQDTDIFRFASDVFEDQTMEIARMQKMLESAP